jgi:diguanylate cyclase (GGDEF)-like protein
MPDQSSLQNSLSNPAGEPGSNVLDDRWVNRTTRAARRAVLIAYLVTLLFVVVLALERFAFTSANQAAMRDVKTSHQIMSNILLEDERLTMSAYMAAATGDLTWVKRYEVQIPLMDAAISAAIAIAPPEAAKRFDQATRISNDKLVAMERAAFARIDANDLVGARTILNSESYAEHKAILAKGSSEFTEQIQSAVNIRLAEVEKHSWWIAALLSMLGFVGFFALWKGLNRHLHIADATLSKKQAQIRDMALTDSLTGLANRRYLMMQLERELARAHRDSAGFAILLIDLDGFKPINDRYGHEVGDAVLKEVARRLSASARESDLVARLGGDEFVLLLPMNNDDPNIEQTARKIADKIIHTLTQDIQVGEHLLCIGASVGFSLGPSDGKMIDELMRKADQALYRVKAAGGNAVHRSDTAHPLRQFQNEVS